MLESSKRLPKHVSTRTLDVVPSFGVSRVRTVVSVRRYYDSTPLPFRLHPSRIHLPRPTLRTEGGGLARRVWTDVLAPGREHSLTTPDPCLQVGRGDRTDVWILSPSVPVRVPDLGPEGYCRLESMCHLLPFIDEPDVEARPTDI